MFNSIYKNYEPNKANRPPICTLKELSQTTGIPYATLIYRMSVTDSPPEIKHKIKNYKYYAISDLKKWLLSYT
jgi:hypothetical protein